MDQNGSKMSKMQQLLKDIIKDCEDLGWEEFGIWDCWTERKFLRFAISDTSKSFEN